MTQYEAWEKEYRAPQLLTGRDVPQNDVLRFLKYVKKTGKQRVEDMTVLDLGSGTGRNANYIASLDNEVVGMEISPTAIKLAKARADKMELDVSYLQQSIDTKYTFPDNHFDLILDITTSNSLNEKEREAYLEESYRVLKSTGYFFVRALCKDGDKNAKNLIKLSPGPEYDTYIMRELGLVERVFSEEDFRKLYGKYFEIVEIVKKKGYARLNNQSYKRIYLLAYLKKKK